MVRLCLLVTYLQNGIEEPWQRIPSIIAVFFAEASLVLLDPSHDNHSSINKYLINSPSVNMKVCFSELKFTFFVSICFVDNKLIEHFTVK